jgi:hypothetical protein
MAIRPYNHPVAGATGLTEKEDLIMVRPAGIPALFKGGKMKKLGIFFFIFLLIFNASYNLTRSEVYNIKLPKLREYRKQPCAKNPVPRIFSNNQVYSRNFEEVWTAVIEIISEDNYAVKSTDKLSGLIVIDWMAFIDMAYADCGKGGYDSSSTLFMSNEKNEFEFNIFIKKVKLNLIKVTITCKYRAFWKVEDIYENDYKYIWTDCYSTGKLENEIFAKISEKLKK